MIRNALPASADPASAASPIFFGLIFEGVPALPAKAVTKNRPSHCARQTLADLGLTWVLRGALAGVGLRQRPAVGEGQALAEVARDQLSDGAGSASGAVSRAPVNEEIEGRFGRPDTFGTPSRNGRLWLSCRVPPKSAIGCTPSVHRTNGEGALRVDCAISPGRPARATICAFRPKTGADRAPSELMMRERPARHA